MIKTAKQLKDLIRNLSKAKAADAQLLRNASWRTTLGIMASPTSSTTPMMVSQVPALIVLASWP